MSCIDLHTHTTCSDGTYTPRELIEYAAKKNITAIAVTDHDNLDGTDEAEYYGKKNGLEVIKGIEMSTDCTLCKEIHIVGLFIDSKNKTLVSELSNLKEKRKTRNKKMVEKLNSLGIDISYSELESISSNKIITRAHFAKVIMEKGYASSLKECYDKYLAAGKSAYVIREVISPEKTISLIKKAGGVAVLAHPLLYKLSNTKLNELLKYLSSNGLDALECLYSTHTKEDTACLLKLAEKYNLKLSGGSDFHGSNKPGLDLGTGYGDLYIPYEILENLKRGVKNG